MLDATHKTIQDLLNKGINARDANGKTPLMHAAWTGDAALVKQLLSQGADTTLEDNLGDAVLDFAARQDNLAVVDMVIKSGVNLNRQAGYYQKTAIFTPAEVGRPEVLRHLLKNGANPDLPDKYKMTALQWAAQQGQTECIKALLAHSAKVNTKNHKGITPLMSACTPKGTKQNVELLLDAGASINETAKNGYTALMYAAYYGQAEIAQLLLSRGADRTLKTKKQETALAIAEKHNHATVISLLKT